MHFKANLSLFYDVFEETKCEHNSLSQGGSEMVSHSHTRKKNPLRVVIDYELL